jgi:uncharacterized membrane protein YbjE (DUF340 family)
MVNSNNSITKFVKIDPKDPLKENKNSLVNGINRLSDLMNSIRRDQEYLLLTIATFFFGIFLSSFFNSLIFYLIFGIILLIFLIFATLKNKRDFNNLFQQHEQIVESGNKIGINLKQKI